MMTAVFYNHDPIDRLTALVQSVRKARGITVGVSRNVGSDELGAVGQAFENLLYNPMADYSWRSIRSDARIIETLTRVAENELAG